jgi:hypothetical protein
MFDNQKISELKEQVKNNPDNVVSPKVNEMMQDIVEKRSKTLSTSQLLRQRAQESLNNQIDPNIVEMSDRRYSKISTGWKKQK